MVQYIQRISVVVVLLVGLLLLGGCSEEVDSKETAAKKITGIQQTATVIEVIDGDTIKVEIEGRKESVRFLLIDTPETNHPKLGEQPFGQEAKRFVKEMLPKGTKITYEKDVSDRDKYGRLLGYIYVGDQSVQEALLERGLARVAYIYEPNVKYVDEYRAIQKQAQKKGVGIWSIEDYAQKDGFHPEVMAEPHVKQNKEKQSGIESNDPESKHLGPFVASKNSEVYHKIECKEAEQIKPENRIYFETEQEVQDTGRRRSKAKGCW
ncbi:thermonuclease family protein [Hazenella coriacea]|uniref:Micrococcal nuclease n=1 Tax=Hazenella coriacea TaxID=1179467 RepID=A0A4R3L828_9BACL|nr:thermonuclease family protein [Hazenella coriacea]TCS95712.1 micrococcal nuclease [Hazenella coriacea]